MSNNNDEREQNLGEHDADVAHPFDQTNGIVEGLDGDADSPEQADKNAGTGTGRAFLAAPAPGAQMPAGIVPLGVDDDPNTEADDSDSSPA